MSTKRIFICILLCCMRSFFVQATVFYVTPSGAGSMNGSSWTNAAPAANLQSMINAAIASDAVWVACGTYLPTTGTNRAVSFSMKTGVAVYGGFQGIEITLGDRDLSCGPCSVLSGEIGAPGISDNSYKVVSNQLLDSTAVIDGFVIRDANDNRSPTNNGNGLGGGMYNHGFNPGGYCHPTVRNCVFINNRASWGAGAFNNGYTGGNAEPTYINCVFYQNHAYVEAGGMDSYGVGGNASPKVINTIFYGNTSATNVGAMYAWGGNSGGNCHPLLINCVFANNSAQNGYCGAFIADNLDENGSTSSGSCTVTLRNCIVWNNAATGVGPQFYVKGNGAQIIATYSDIDMTGQNTPHIISGAGTGNLNTNPLFINLANAIGADNCWMSADDGLRLQNNSPCIDAGNNSGIYATDLAGDPRLSGSFVDMGAYEFQASTGFISYQSNEEKIFPNPARDHFILKTKEKSGSLSIYDSKGQEVYRGRFDQANPRIDISLLPSGMYLLVTESVRAKFVKD